MKPPVKPLMPKPPAEPKAPEEFFIHETQLYISSGTNVTGKYSLKELLEQLPKGVSPEDLIFEPDYFSSDFDDGEYAFRIFYKDKIKTYNFKTLNKKYEKLKAEYPVKLENYKIDLESYEYRLKRYNEELEVYTLEKAKADLKKAKSDLSKATKKLSKLTSKKEI